MAIAELELVGHQKAEAALSLLKQELRQQQSAGDKMLLPPEFGSVTPPHSPETAQTNLSLLNQALAAATDRAEAAEAR